MLAERELARRIGDRIETRPDPLRIRFRFDDLVCADNHFLRAQFACSIQALSQPIEQRALAETFLTGSSSLTSEQLTAHFQPALAGAAARIIATRSAEQ